LYINNLDIPHDTHAALSYMLDQERFQDVECFIALNSFSATRHAWEHTPANVLEFLRSLLVADSPLAILVVGSEASVQREMPQIQYIEQRTGMRLIACTTPKAFEAASNRWQPALFLLLDASLKNDEEFRLLLARFSSIPLIVLSRFFGEKNNGLLSWNVLILLSVIRERCFRR